MVKWWYLGDCIKGKIRGTLEANVYISPQKQKAGAHSDLASFSRSFLKRKQNIMLSEVCMWFVNFLWYRCQWDYGSIWMNTLFILNVILLFQEIYLIRTPPEGSQLFSVLSVSEKDLLCQKSLFFWLIPQDMLKVGTFNTHDFPFFFIIIIELNKYPSLLFLLISCSPAYLLCKVYYIFSNLYVFFVVPTSI